MKRILLPCLLLAVLAVPAAAQTIAISGVEGGQLTQQLFPPTGAIFEIAVWIDPAGLGSSAIEFGYTELQQVVPAVIRTGIWTVVEIILVQPCMDETCIFSFGQCLPAVAPLQLARFQYLDFGAIGSDVVLEVRGLGPGDPQPSSFGGAPGFVDCDENLVPLTPGGTGGGVTGAGVVFADGAMVLNPTPVVVGSEAASFARLKARFDD